jgi:carbon monoxide dehydrogenase subunit G
MDMTGERLIAAPREAVWTALNDPEVLKACIPGCESIEQVSPTELKALAAVKLGPISARFTGKMDLSDVDPPNSYTISGEGQGGVAGFAKGSAKVRLADEAGGTRLFYVVNSQIGGKMAQLGARLIDSTAKSYAETFFTRFSERVAPAPAEAAMPAGAEPVLVESIAVRQIEPLRQTEPPRQTEPLREAGPVQNVVVHEHAHDHSHDHGAEPEYDHSNPVIAGLPLGIWIPMIIAIVMVIIVMVKFV